MNRTMEKDGLVGKVVKVKYYRTQGYPAGSRARVLGWYGGTIEHPAILYELEFSDGAAIFVPRDEFEENNEWRQRDVR
ncbi:unnamed protein product [marine sediment metagenome]|uniref:Uncharacterized protein n=1 Tax=marine sediment metagenome TaxID=412755 RepID=X1C3I6_9ZZZZ